MTILVAAIVASAIVGPHLARLERARPSQAVTIWTCALALRALTAAFFALFAIFYLRASVVLGLVTHWCWHAVLPLVTTHLGFNGHELANAATIAPSLALAGSLVSACYGVLRATRAIRKLVRRATLGEGPENSVVVGGDEVLLAAAGLARPRVLVSAGALTTLDDGELKAGLAHEQGHIARRHRFILLFAEFCRALARFLPGTRRAMSELLFHLERDADAWALRRSDPLDLASAICKAAGLREHGSALALSGGAGSRRLTELLDGEAGMERGFGPTTVLATTLVTLTLGLTALLPAAAWAGVHELRADSSVHHCPG